MMINIISNIVSIIVLSRRIQSPYQTSPERSSENPNIGVLRSRFSTSYNNFGVF